MSMLAEVVVSAAAVVAAVGVLWRRPKAVKQRLTDFLADWHGEPPRPGNPGRPSIPERLADVEQRTAQLVPNSGSSIADKVDHLVREMDHVRREVQGVDERVTDHRRRNDETIANLRAEVERRLDAFAVAEAYRSILAELGHDSDLLRREDTT